MGKTRSDADQPPVAARPRWAVPVLLAAVALAWLPAQAQTGNAKPSRPAAHKAAAGKAKAATIKPRRRVRPATGQS